MHRRSSFFLFLSSLLLLPSQGLAAEQLPKALQTIEERGAKIVGSFEAPGGLTGYAARYNGQALALYLTADGQHVIIGSLLDADGKDLSETPLEQLVYEPMGQEMWQSLENSTWIADGKADAPRIVYMFSDPNCPYCNMFWQQARPWVEAGDVQLRHVMVGMLRPDSAGKSARLLSATDPSAALHTHESAGKASSLSSLGSIPKELQTKLDANLELMAELGGSATPSIYYLDGNGRLQQHQGAPRGESLQAIMGPLSRKAE